MGSRSRAGDDLPDYVMIMIANKRTKDQMTDELKIFLGINTDLFVNWLHQVLDKLEKVTLPATGMWKITQFTIDFIELTN